MTTISTAALDKLATSTGEASKKAAEQYNQFLVLLTTQLQHQDPLDPLDSTEFTNQLVQFSQVEQQILANEKTDLLLAMQNNMFISSSLQYIGKAVYYRGDTVYMDEQPVRIGYTLEAPPKDAKMLFINEDGETVRTINMPSDITTSNIVWDGKDDFGQPVAAGVYDVRITALDRQNGAVKSYTGVPANVLGVETINGSVYLSIDGDRQIDAENVLSVSMPETGTPDDSGGEEETTT